MICNGATWSINSLLGCITFKTKRRFLLSIFLISFASQTLIRLQRWRNSFSQQWFWTMPMTKPSSWIMIGQAYRTSTFLNLLNVTLTFPICHNRNKAHWAMIISGKGSKQTNNCRLSNRSAPISTLAWILMMTWMTTSAMSNQETTLLCNGKLPCWLQYLMIQSNGFTLWWDIKVKNNFRGHYKSATITPN